MRVRCDCCSGSGTFFVAGATRSIRRSTTRRLKFACFQDLLNVALWADSEACGTPDKGGRTSARTCQPLPAGWVAIVLCNLLSAVSRSRPHPRSGPW